MAALVCSMSGEPPVEPVVSRKSGHLFEKKSVLKYLLEAGTCPVTGEELSPSDLVDLKPHTAVRPKPVSATSLPGLMGLFQSEWDSSVAETYELRKELEQVRSELAHTLYQHDAACRVIAKLIKERDDAVAAMQEQMKRGGAAPAGGAPAAAGDRMDVDGGPGITEAMKDKMTEKSTELSKGRKKREISANLATEEVLQQYGEMASYPAPGAAQPTAIDIHQKNPNLLMIGCADSTVMLMDRAPNQARPMPGHTGRVNRVLFHNTQDLCFSAGADCTTRVWSASTAAPVRVFQEHRGEVTGLSLHATGDFIVTASKDKTWAFYDLETGTCRQVVSDAAVTDGYSTCMLHPDGLILGTGTINQFVRVWDVKTQQNVVSFPAHPSAVASLCFSENGYHLATTGADGVKVWDLRKLAKQGAAAGAVKHFELDAAEARFDFSGTYLMAGGAGIKGWHTKTWNEVLAVPTAARLSALAVGPDARCVAGGMADSTVKLWGV